MYGMNDTLNVRGNEPAKANSSGIRKKERRLSNGNDNIAGTFQNLIQNLTGNIKAKDSPKREEGHTMDRSTSSVEKAGKTTSLTERNQNLSSSNGGRTVDYKDKEQSRIPTDSGRKKNPDETISDSDPAALREQRQDGPAVKDDSEIIVDPEINAKNAVNLEADALSNENPKVEAEVTKDSSTGKTEPVDMEVETDAAKSLQAGRKEITDPNEDAKDTSIPKEGLKDTAILNEGEKDTAVLNEGKKDTAAFKEGRKDTAIPKDGSTDPALSKEEIKAAVNPAKDTKDTVNQKMLSDANDRELLSISVSNRENETGAAGAKDSSAEPIAITNQERDAFGSEHGKSEGKVSWAEVQTGPLSGKENSSDPKALDSNSSTEALENRDGKDLTALTIEAKNRPDSALKSSRKDSGNSEEPSPISPSNIYNSSQNVEIIKNGEGSAFVAKGQMTTSPARLPEDLSTLITKTWKANENRPGTMELTLNPENLGKITIHLTYESGRANLTILTTKPETFHLLSEHAEKMGEILTRSTGKETAVILPPNMTDSGEKTAMNLEGRSQNRREADEGQKRQKQKQESHDRFLNMMRLGLD
ncbi:MAG: flagellar hook-length control protein FliK [Lachnospiraceae bacterium]|nr:flagellar hook-length control protein FliK [Lachnospiraceae bacterium]